MSSIVLCSCDESSKPYYIKESELNIYSVEELAYYLYNNLYYVDDDFINKSLIGWIFLETDHKQLAEDLRVIAREERVLSRGILAIIRASLCYSDEDIALIEETLSSLEKRTREEKIKAKADLFYNKQKYNSAVANYQNCLELLSSHNNIELEGDIYNNLGAAYANLFLFKEAAAAFERAYELNKKEECRKQMFLAILMLGDEKLLHEKRELFAEHAERINEWRHRLEVDEDEMHNNREYQTLINAQCYKEDGAITEYYAEINGLIDNWKREYREES